MSALKEHAVWFVTPFRHLEHGWMTADIIRSKLGNFDVVSKYPARYAARISQAFSATDPSITLEAEEIINGRDIESFNEEGDVILFTDGVGTMSRDTAERIGIALAENRAHRRNARHRKPLEQCAYQVRIGGSKGMLSVDWRFNDSAICLRPSMTKFDAPDSRDIEIAGTFERTGLTYLNRPLIMMLETLGVRAEVFEQLQDNVTAEVHIASSTMHHSAKLLQMYGLGTAFRLTSVFTGLAKMGMVHPPNNPFYTRGINYAINDVLRSLKHKARIPVPDSHTLVGVADIHKVLKEGQIFGMLNPLCSIHGLKCYHKHASAILMAGHLSSTSKAQHLLLVRLLRIRVMYKSLKRLVDRHLARNTPLANFSIVLSSLRKVVCVVLRTICILNSQ